MAMKIVKVSIRAGGKERGNVRLKKGNAAIVFTTSSRKRIEVDLMETPGGNILLRSHDGTVSVCPNDGTLEITSKG